MIIFILGVSGSGKTTVGKLLAERLEIPFFDGDVFHPASNVEKMRGGTPLTDEDREGWLDAINEAAQQAERAVFACSGLKES
jgi:gluconokinase